MRRLVFLLVLLVPWLAWGGTNVNILQSPIYQQYSHTLFLSPVSLCPGNFSLPGDCSATSTYAQKFVVIVDYVNAGAGITTYLTMLCKGLEPSIILASNPTLEVITSTDATGLSITKPSTYKHSIADSPAWIWVVSNIPSPGALCTITANVANNDDSASIYTRLITP